MVPHPIRPRTCERPPTLFAHLAKAGQGGGGGNTARDLSVVPNLNAVPDARASRPSPARPSFRVANHFIPRISNRHIVLWLIFVISVTFVVNIFYDVFSPVPQPPRSRWYPISPRVIASSVSRVPAPDHGPDDPGSPLGEPKWAQGGPVWTFFANAPLSKITVFSLFLSLFATLEGGPFRKCGPQPGPRPHAPRSHTPTRCVSEATPSEIPRHHLERQSLIRA